MKKFFHAAALIIMTAALLLISACAPTADNTDMKTTNDTTEKEHSLADQVAYREALSLKRTDFCDKIKEESFKNECKTGVTDSQQYDRAVTEENIAHCDPISNQELKEACKVQIEIKVELKAESIKLEEESAKIDAIVASKDFARCKAELTLVQTISACQANIITPQAVEKKNANLCAQIEDDAAEESCRKTVSGKTENPST